MPGRSGLDILRDIKGLRPKLPILVLSMHPEDQYGKRVLKTGAAGYMNKGRAPQELIDAVRKILAGGRYVSPTLAEILVWDLDEDTTRPLHETLSNRVFEVVRMIASGNPLAPNTARAILAGISENCIESSVPLKVHAHKLDRRITQEFFDRSSATWRGEQEALLRKIRNIQASTD